MADRELDLVEVIEGAHIRQEVANRVLLTKRNPKIKFVFKLLHRILYYCWHKNYSPSWTLKAKGLGRKTAVLAVKLHLASALSCYHTAISTPVQLGDHCGRVYPEEASLTLYTHTLPLYPLKALCKTQGDLIIKEQSQLFGLGHQEWKSKWKYIRFLV